MNKIIVAILLVVMFAALIYSTVNAGTGPGEFTCDLVSYGVEEFEDSSIRTVRMFYCNENVAMRGDVCHLWRITVNEPEERIFDGLVITWWYMCNEFSL